MPVSIRDKGHTTKDSSEELLYLFDYDVLDNLRPGVELATMGTFTITPSGLTQASQALEAGNRSAHVLIGGGIVGRTYTIEHTVQTNETPAQTKSKWFRLRIT